MTNPTFDMQTFMQGFIDAINKGKDNGMKSSNVGYFYPDAPVDWGETSMIVHDGKTYYRDANAFASRLNVLSASKGWKNVSEAVDGCLIGEAVTWWNTTLCEESCIGFIAADNSTLFTNALTEHFKPPPSQAFDKLNMTRYTVENCRKRRSISAYVAEIQWAVTNCFGIDVALSTTVSYAWRHLDIDLRQAIPEPEKSMTIETFTQLLLSHQSNWFDKFPPAITPIQNTVVNAVSRALRPFALQQERRPWQPQQRRQYNNNWRDRQDNTAFTHLGEARGFTTYQFQRPAISNQPQPNAPPYAGSNNQQRQLIGPLPAGTAQQFT